MAFLNTFLAGATLFALQTATAQVVPSDIETQLRKALEQIESLAKQVASQEARIHELEAARVSTPPAPTAVAAPAVLSTPEQPAVTPPDTMQDTSMGGHNMAIPGGPVLNIRGFFDFNFGVGSIANPLIYPIASDGCAVCGNPVAPAHTAFQAGEFDLLFTSKLSDRLSFLAEVVLGPDTTNEFGPDIERYQLTYRANRYFSASAGRFHTSIGYYNTAYHHGNWFSTAEGRPIMYLFEDTGGVLPVHMVGATFAGEVPGTEKLGLHWIAEVGNGRASTPGGAEVQNFYTDRNYKATNLAGFIRPQAAPGLQIGGSWYHDGMRPAGLPGVRQNIESAYAVYLTSDWEFLTEGVLLSNHLLGVSDEFRSPMAYSQIAHKFGIYKPYFRYQYANDSMRDPVNILRGRYYGPSLGLRIDFAEFAALKLQYNHLFQSNQLPGNGFNAQVAFTF